MANGQKILMTGATGYIANQLLPTFRETYEMVLIDVKAENPSGERVEGVVTADLIDPDRSKYAALFEGVDAVVHLGYKRRTGEPLDHFFGEKENVEMAYNVLRSAYDNPAFAQAQSLRLRRDVELRITIQVAAFGLDEFRGLERGQLAGFTSRELMSRGARA